MKQNLKKVIVLLVVAVLTISAGVACLLIEGGGEVEAGGQYIYNPLPRKTRLSLETMVRAEGFIDGEQGAEALRVMHHQPYYYVFGSSTSRERDFAREDEGSCAFVALVGSLGTVFSLSSYSGARFITAKNIGSGFALLLDAGGTSKLVLMDYSGAFIKEVDAPRNPLDMYLNTSRSRLAVVTGEGELSLSLYSLELLLDTVTIIGRADPIEYVSMLASGSRYILFVNVLGTNITPSIVTVNEGFSFDDFSGELLNCRLIDFCPASIGGYLLGVIDTKSNDLAKLVHYKTVTTTILAGGNNSTSVDIIDGDNEYLFKWQAAGISTVAKLDKSLNIEVSSVSALGGSKSLIGLYSIGSHTLMLFSENGMTGLSLYGSNNVLLFLGEGAPLTVVTNTPAPILFYNNGTPRLIIPELTFI